MGAGLPCTVIRAWQNNAFLELPAAHRTRGFPWSKELTDFFRNFFTPTRFDPLFCHALWYILIVSQYSANANSRTAANQPGFTETEQNYRTVENQEEIIW